MKTLKSIIGIISFIILAGGIPFTVHAVEMNLESTGSKPVVIDRIISVGPSDILRIPQGTKVEVRPGAGIFSKGLVFIGVDSSSQNIKNKTVTITSSSTKPFIDTSGGHVIAINVDFKGVVFATGYNKGEISVSSSTLIDITTQSLYSSSPFISIYNTSKLDLSYSTILSRKNIGSSRTRNYLFEIYSGSNGTVTATRIYSDISKEVINVYGNSRIHFENANILSCARWLTLYSTSQATGDLNMPICSASTPYIFSNSVSTIVYKGEKCCSSVLLIPGLQGSRLYRKKTFENRLWEPNRDADVEKLFLDLTGASIVSGIYTRDILDRVEILNTGIGKFSYYYSFLKFLKILKENHFIEDYQTFPYDWRLSPEDIVSDSLIRQIDQMSLASSNGKVTLIAHSYGGLVAKSLLSKLKERDREFLIDKVILTAVPETGTPSALFTTLHGENQSIMWGLIQKASTAMNMAINMPSAYALLPSATFAKTITLTIKMPSQIHPSTYNLPLPVTLQASIDWIKAITGNLPLSSKSLLMQKASNLLLETRLQGGQHILRQADPTLSSTYKIWSLAGIGLQTMNGMNYEYIPCKTLSCKNKATLLGKTTYLAEGDGTVILDAPFNRLGTLLKIDLPKLNKLKKSNFSHANILESADVQDTIKSILENGDSATFPGGYIYQNDIGSEQSQLYSIHIDGEVTGGISYTNSDIKYETKIVKQNDTFVTIQNVPNSAIIKMGNSTNITSQEKPDTISFVSDQSQHIDISNAVLPSSSDGGWYGGGSTGGTLGGATTETFSNIPVGTGSVIEIHTASSTVTIDIDADGDIDRTYTASSTATSTPSTASSSVQIMMYDLARLIETADLLITETNHIQVFSLRNTNVKKLMKSKLMFVQTLATFRKYFGNDGSMTHTYGPTIIQKESEKIFQDLKAYVKGINRILEQEDFYQNQITNINEYILERGARGVSNRTLMKKTNAQSQLRDLGYLYVILSDIGDRELEFLTLHGSISLERLQRP